MKFHPSLQAFAPDDPAYWPIFAACEQHGLLALFHTGTSGIGARQPGGQGIRIDYAHPLKLDSVAAAHPGLTVVAAHFGWPWHMDLIAMALHKTNVYIDISGWSPRRIPPEVIRELKGRLSGQFLWGSDFPFLTPERCLAEFDDLGVPAEVADQVLRDNAARILGLSLTRAGAAARARPRSRPDARQHQRDVVLAVIAQRPGHHVADLAQRGPGPGQAGAQGVAQRGHAAVERPGPAFHQPVGVQGEGRPARQADLGRLEGFSAEAERQAGRQVQHPRRAVGLHEHRRQVPGLGGHAPAARTGR